MKFGFHSGAVETAQTDAIAVGVREGSLKKDATLKAIDAVFPIFEHAADLDFSGKESTVCRVAVRATNSTTKNKSKAGPRWVVLVGLGKDDAGANSGYLLGVHAGRQTRSLKSLTLVVPTDDAASVEAAVSGVTQGLYRYDDFRSPKNRKKATLQNCQLVATASAAAKRAVKDGQVLGDAVNLARDLVNAPPNELTPKALANAAKREVTKAGAKATVHGKKWLQNEKMELFLAVNRGSAEEPYLAHMTYKPRGAKKKVVFVGKGLTFDAGGLCVKPPNFMSAMKCDMAGAAATIGIVAAAARLKLPIEVHGIIGCTENMLGARAFRPDDVYRSRQGKTVEIINTDAEGRLVLADCLSYAADLKPDLIVDHATLTGASMIALGPWRGSVFGNNDKLRASYWKAAGEAGESYWQMPLDKDLREMLKSEIADLKHLGERAGGSITAALFLKEFVGDCDWIHCDIAGPAFLESEHGTSPRGGTGFGVLTGIQYLRSLV